MSEIGELQRSVGRMEGQLQLVLEKVSVIDERQAQGHICFNLTRIENAEGSIKRLSGAASERKGVRNFLLLLIPIASTLFGAIGAYIALKGYHGHS